MPGLFLSIQQVLLFARPGQKRALASKPFAISLRPPPLGFQTMISPE
jgi:hypothetical protein